MLHNTVQTAGYLRSRVDGTCGCGQQLQGALRSLHCTSLCAFTWSSRGRHRCRPPACPPVAVYLISHKPQAPRHHWSQQIWLCDINDGFGDFWRTCDRAHPCTQTAAAAAAAATAATTVCQIQMCPSAQLGRQLPDGIRPRHISPLYHISVVLRRRNISLQHFDSFDKPTNHLITACAAGDWSSVLSVVLGSHAVLFQGRHPLNPL